MRLVKKCVLSFFCIVILFFGLLCPVYESKMISPFVVKASAIAVSGSCGSNLRWEYDRTNSVLKIFGNGEMYDYGKTTFWNGLGLNNIKTIIISDGVTSIGAYAFSCCYSLTNVTIPSSVTTIGGYAFEYCKGLTSITIPDSVTSIGGYAFEYCKGLTSITIPDSVTSIDPGVFYECTSLTSITIPDSVTTIGNYAFSGCTGLTSITIPDSVTTLGNYAFSGCTGLTSITIPDSVTTIGNYAFSGCTGLTSITIPESVTSIGGSAFYGCLSIESITVDTGNPVYHSANNCLIKTSNKILVAGCKNSVIPDDGSVTSIGDGAFQACACLTNITIPDSVKYIGRYAFSGCTSLTSIIVPDSVTSIGDSAFDEVPNVIYCGSNSNSQWKARSINGFVDGYLIYSNQDKTNLLACSGAATGSIIIPNSVTCISDNAFYNCNKISKITIPNSVISIGSNAFSECTGLTNIIYNAVDVSCLKESAHVFKNAGTSGEGITVVFDDCVKSIPSYLFYGSKIKTVIISNSVTSIGDGAFLECTKLTNVTIGNGVTSIGPRAFGDCTGLTSVTIGNSVTSIGERAFSFCTSLTNVTIPDSVTNIGEHAFSSCTSLTSITIPGSVINTGRWSFDCCTNLASVTIGNGVKYIEEGTFYNCRSLSSVTIPDSVASIKDYVFCYCYSLTDITIPNSVTSIGSSAFSRVPNIVYFGSASGSPWFARSVNGYVDGYLVYLDQTRTKLLSCSGEATGNIRIPDSVTSIGRSAFESCSGLTSIILPDSVKYIDYYTFRFCTGLKEVIFGNSVTGISNEAFRNCTSLTNISIPDSVTFIGVDAFKDCTSLTSITIPDSVSRIDGGAFEGCTGLTSAILGAGVTTVPQRTFDNCTGLLSVTIPESITMIYSDNFDLCYRDIVIYGKVSSYAQTYAIGIGIFKGIYTATYSSNGENISVYEVKEGSYIDKPDNPTKDGYIFKGWDPVIPNIMPANDMTFTAVFEPIPDIASRSIDLPESGCIVRGNTLTWTVVTSADVSLLKFVGTYPVGGGSEKKLTLLYKAETYLAEPTDAVSITDNGDGTYTWTIKVKYTYSVNMSKITETWKMYYRTGTGTEYFCYDDTEGVEPVTITIGKTAQDLVDPISGYDKYTLVSASCEAGNETVAHNARKNITIVTTDDCTKVRIGVNGKNATYQESSTNTTVTRENGLMIWVISYKFTQSGENTYSVSTRGSAWSEAKTFTVTVE